MAINKKLVEEACLSLWKEYHKEIEKLEYKLSNDSYSQNIKGFQIVASISPNYSNEDLKKIRKIIPREFEYKGQKLEVMIFPSISEIFKTAHVSKI